MAKTKTCGDKNLIRAAGGQTFDRPCAGAFGVSVYCNQPDYEDWRVRIDELAEMLRITWNRLMDIEREQPEQTYEHTRAVRDWYDQIIARIEAVPDSTLLGPLSSKTSKGIATMVAIAQDEVCLLETMRNAIAAYGQKAPPVPYVEPEKGPQIDIGGAAEALTKGTTKIVETLAWPAAVMLGIVGGAYVLRPVITKVVAQRSKR